MNNKIKKTKGFTLTELIVVIVIIGILAAVLIPTLTGYIKKANQSADEQEVAMLNKMTMLWDYEDNKPASVNELKELLEEEGYSGNYSLRVKGNYLWYDVKENRFAILNEEKLETLGSGNLQNLATDPETYKLTTNMKSPEGLLNNNGYEVWLVGGNGDLVEIVKNIRNIGDYDTTNGAIILKESLDNVNEISSAIYSNLSNLINTSIFYGSQKTEIMYSVNASNVTVTEDATDRNDNVISSDIINIVSDLNKKIEFFNNVIKGKNEQGYDHLLVVNALLMKKIEGVQTSFAKISIPNNKPNFDGSYDVKIEIEMSNAYPTDAIEAFKYIFNLIQVNGVTKASITPIINGEPIALKSFDLFLEQFNSDSLTMSSTVDLNVTNKLTLASLLVCAVNYSDAFVSMPNVETMEIGDLCNKNEVQIRGVVNDGTQEYEIVYNFSFTK